VVLVDDVLTTGTTLRCAALALRASGTRWLGALTAARRP
jgi:predicted amidophosphoribosyltransferase